MIEKHYVIVSTEMLSRNAIFKINNGVFEHQIKHLSDGVLETLHALG